MLRQDRRHACAVLMPFECRTSLRLSSARFHHSRRPWTRRSAWPTLCSATKPRLRLSARSRAGNRPTWLRSPSRSPRPRPALRHRPLYGSTPHTDVPSCVEIEPQRCLPPLSVGQLQVLSWCTAAAVPLAGDCAGSHTYHSLFPLCQRTPLIFVALLPSSVPASFADFAAPAHQSITRVTQHTSCHRMHGLSSPWSPPRHCITCVTASGGCR